jgi:hypothetical protein
LRFIPWVARCLEEEANNLIAIALAAAYNHTIWLRDNGTIIAWGNNANGQTNVPSGLSNVVAIAAGGAQAMALRRDGTVTNWGATGGSIPGNLTNAMAVAAGYVHGVALRNDATVVSWGNNSNGQTNVPTWLGPVKLIAAGGNQSLASMFSALVQYPVDVSKDLLLIYNTNSLNSSNVLYYYMQHRPMVSNANVLPIGCPAGDVMGTNEFITQLETPLRNWFEANPTKHPTYVILFLNISSRMTNTHYPEVYGSVSFALHERMYGTRPFVTHINMDGTNDCIGYINKLAAFGTNGQVIISASAGGFANTNYYFDDNRDDPPYGAGPSIGALARDAVLSASADALVTYRVDNSAAWISNGVHVAAYFSWGGHSPALRADYPWDGKVVFGTNSQWFLIGTVESGNGIRDDLFFGTFDEWFATGAFGGANYASTPVGAVSHVAEPGGFGNDAAILFGLWAQTRSLGICAWVSRRTPFTQVVGDPLVRR